MRSFVDLHLVPFNQEQNEKIMKKAIDLGYSAIGVVSNIRRKSNNNLDIIKRVDLKPENRRDLLRTLKKTRNKVEIICVTCTSKNVARQAAKDHRVDILNFPIDFKRKYIWFDQQEASLASDSNCSYEVNIVDLLKQGSENTAYLIRKIKKEISIAKRNDVPIVVSSGASEYYDMREPRAILALLDLLDIDEEQGLDMISIIPMTIVEKNREKLGENFIEPGVWRIKNAG